jgi:predicted deacylase
MNDQSDRTECAQKKYFSTSYFEARKKFANAAKTCRWSVVRHPIAKLHPDGEVLTIDLAASDTVARKTLLLSSGLHGVEGYFGSAIQLAVLQAVDQGTLRIPPGCRIVMIHALNPYGFAFDRRVNENNIDLNRNFLLADESYAGSPAGYADLAQLINPTSIPKLDIFKLRFIWKILTVGMTKLKSAIAGGQYDAPKGLFFGGNSPSETFEIVRQELPSWILPGSQAAIMLDFHSGLGKFGDHALLTTSSEKSIAANSLAQAFDPGKISCLDSSKVAYPARGVMTEWVGHHQTASQFLAFGVEFGTYGPLRILSALRHENQCHLNEAAGTTAYEASKAEMREAFCPQDEGWRQKVVFDSMEIVKQSLESLGEV